MTKTSSYFDHVADIGIIGHGSILEEAFEAAAEATFSIMTDIASLREDRQLVLGFQESDIEYALVTWLNLLLAEAKSEGLILGRFKLSRKGDQWSGKAWGQPWESHLERGVEVKGATLTMLSVRKAEDGWEARCIVDV